MKCILIQNIEAITAPSESRCIHHLIDAWSSTSKLSTTPVSRSSILLASSRSVTPRKANYENRLTVNVVRLEIPLTNETMHIIYKTSNKAR